MGLMSYIHRRLLRRGALLDVLPREEDIGSDDKPEREAAKAEIEARVVEEKEMQKEVAAAVKRLRDLNMKNHYGESLRKALGGK